MRVLTTNCWLSNFALSTIQLGKHIVFIVGGVIWRFVKRRDHGPYLTIVEEIMREFYVRAIGRFAWTGMKDSIEQKIRQLQRSKAALVQDVLGEETFAQALTLDDLRFLFADEQATSKIS